MSAFQNRWLIKGTLTTESPLHIGSGEDTYRAAVDDVVRKRDAARAQRAARQRRGSADPRHGRVQIAAVMGASQPNDGLRPIIPGTVIKNLVRRALEPYVGTGAFQSLLGTNELNVEYGSRVTCFDAAACLPFVEHPPPYWEVRRQTSVASFVAIDRRSRTAADDHLFHVEFVPPRVTFDVEIGAENLAHTATDTNSELVALLAALHLAGSTPIPIGANTAAGWGRVSWQTTSLCTIDAGSLAQWIGRRGSRACGYDAGEKIAPAVLRAIDSAAVKLAEQWKQASSLRSSSLTISFASHFLVNDPSQCGEAPKADHTPLLDWRRAIALPGSSLHGALRAQAERILRTIGQRACTPSAPCHPLESLQQINRLCYACRLFGASGWRSPLMLTDFSGPLVAFDGDRNPQLHQQEFVALDRFTGGGAPGRKFNARSWYQPVLTGGLSIDRARLAHTGVGPALEGLLMLVLRDLAEGDVPLGFGAGKGYGACSIDGFDAQQHADRLGFGAPRDGIKALTGAN